MKIKKNFMKLELADRKGLQALLFLISLNLVINFFEGYDTIREKNDISSLKYYLKDGTDLHRADVQSNVVEIVVFPDYKYSNGFAIAYNRKTDHYHIRGLNRDTCKLLKRDLKTSYLLSCKTPSSVLLRKI